MTILGNRVPCGKTGDVVELLEILGRVILKCPGYCRKGSTPRRVTERAAHQGRSAGLDGTSTARYLPAKAQRPEQSYSRAFCKIRSRAGCVAGKSDIVLLTY